MPDEVMDVFVAVDSEVDGLPLGTDRQYWNKESLRAKDLEAALAGLLEVIKRNGD